MGSRPIRSEPPTAPTAEQNPISVTLRATPSPTRGEGSVARLSLERLALQLFLLALGLGRDLLELHGLQGRERLAGRALFGIGEGAAVLLHPFGDRTQIPSWPASGKGQRYENTATTQRRDLLILLRTEIGGEKGDPCTAVHSPIPFSSQHGACADVGGRSTAIDGTLA